MAQLVTKKNVAVDLNSVAVDIVKYGTPAVTVFEVLANTLPNVNIGGGGQAILSAVIGLLTTVLSFEKNKSAATPSTTAGLTVTKAVE
jgi:hypothetical protein